MTMYEGAKDQQKIAECRDRLHDGSVLSLYNSKRSVSKRKSLISSSKQMSVNIKTRVQPESCENCSAALSARAMSP